MRLRHLAGKAVQSVFARTSIGAQILQERAHDKARIKTLQAELDRWKIGAWPPGHYYSPILDYDEHKHRLAAAPATSSPEQVSVPAIDLNPETQFDCLSNLARYYDNMPFGHEATPGLRYFLNNPFYAYADGITLHGMLRLHMPTNVIEVGSGFSSALVLDTRDLFLGGNLACTFIEPNPERLQGLLKSQDNASVSILCARVQDVPLETFDSLRENDILIIDSSHVSKAGSDVNTLFFNVLPRLARGVLVHIHDVFYPFEYPEAWLRAGRNWNEAYLARAFLQYNRAFEIVLMTSFAALRWHDWLRSHMPLYLESPTYPETVPGSLWIRRT